ncbi:CHAT domain-containing protein [Streptomyces sp. NBC_00853]|uniref:CHAT domain-containing protein n=1 Tax=Streptomyces sp. NBC_00853 TaxID=2903681 RepID=UPI0038738B10|nr:CHAT domain-containing protein [Streptomyces sp. NBC_00853]
MIGKLFGILRQARLRHDGSSTEAELLAAGAGRLSDRRLDELIEALEATDPADPGYGLAQHHLQLALLLRYRGRGAAADLDRKLELATDMLGWVPEDHPGHVLAQGHRLVTLLMVYEKEGAPALLDEVVDTGQPLLADDTLDPQLRLWLADTVSSALVSRFKRNGRKEDLTRGVELLREMCDSTRPGSPDREQFLAKLGVALLFLHEMSEDAADLDEAVRRCREAARTTLPSYPEHPAIQSNLALVLAHAGRARAATPEGRAMLLEAVEAGRTSVRSAPPGHPALIDLLNHHVGSLMTAGELLARTDLLDEALQTCAVIVERLPADHPTYAECLTNRGTAARMRYDLSGDAADAATAVAAWREAVGATGGRPWARLDAAQKWGLLAGKRGEWATALEGYRAAVHLLPELAHRGLERSDQELHLSRRAWAGMASDAAACALHAQEPAAAVELLERGRAVTWAQSLTGPDATGSDAGPALLTFEDLVSGWAVDGPAVLINFSRWRSDALVVSSAGLRVVPLPGLRFEEAVDLLAGHLGVLLGEEEAEPEDRQTRARMLLEWAWDVIAEPVMAALGLEPDESGQELPRIWWCPTSLLSFVPLHAAGRHDGAAGRGASVMDRAVSSYTPTLRLLSGAAPAPEATKPPGPGGVPPRLLIATVPEAEGLWHLSVPEAKRLAELFPGDRHTALDGPEAGQERVREELRRHPYVHFGCHGRQDLADPSQGGLVLYDGVLTIARLVEDAHPGRLAFLAACHTATGGLVNMDEAISLTAALRFAGWQDVVGSVWSASEISIPDVAKAVFAAVAGQDDLPPDAVARAVHAATRELRNRLGDELPALWAPFLHMGR